MKRVFRKAACVLLAAALIIGGTTSAYAATRQNRTCKVMASKMKVSTERVSGKSLRMTAQVGPVNTEDWMCSFKASGSAVSISQRGCSFCNATPPGGKVPTYSPGLSFATVTAKKAGTSTIIVSSGDGKVKRIIKVRVTKDRKGKLRIAMI